MTLLDLKTTGRRQLRRLRHGLTPAPAPVVEEWATPPERGAARPDVHALVLAGPLLTQGLAREWTQTVPANPIGPTAAQAFTGIDVMLLEYVDGGLVGREGAEIGRA